MSRLFVGGRIDLGGASIDPTALRDTLRKPNSVADPSSLPSRGYRPNSEGETSRPFIPFRAGTRKSGGTDAGPNLTDPLVPASGSLYVSEFEIGGRFLFAAVALLPWVIVGGLVIAYMTFA